MKPSKINKPLQYGTKEELCKGEEKIFSTTFTDITIENNKLDTFVFDGCILEKIIISNSSFSRIEFVDTIFENCDFSNINFSNASFHRVTFINSKLTGLITNNSLFEDVCFKDCNIKYADFFGSKINSIKFDRVNLTESYFGNVEMKKIIFKNANLTQCDFSDTKLKDVDLSSSEINGIKLNIYSLEGCIIDITQADLFAKMLGLRIKQEIEDV